MRLSGSATMALLLMQLQSMQTYLLQHNRHCGVFELEAQELTVIIGLLHSLDNLYDKNGVVMVLLRITRTWQMF